MVENKQDALIRAYAMLSSLRKNIELLSGVSEKYVNEFHTVLDSLESIGINVSEFRIPGSEIAPAITSITRSGPSSYSSEKYVEKRFILIKLDALLNYFKIITSEQPRKIGFRKPDSR